MSTGVLGPSYLPLVTLIAQSPQSNASGRSELPNEYGFNYLPPSHHSLVHSLQSSNYTHSLTSILISFCSDIHIMKTSVFALGFALAQVYANIPVKPHAMRCGDGVATCLSEAIPCDRNE